MVCQLRHWYIVKLGPVLQRQIVEYLTLIFKVTNFEKHGFDKHDIDFQNHWYTKAGPRESCDIDLQSH